MRLNLIQKARKSALIPIDDFADYLGVSTPTLSKWENEPDKYFTPAILRKYYDVVGMDGKKYLLEYVDSFFV